MRTPNPSTFPLRSRLRIAVAALVVLLVAAPAATARSVSDPDIGWPSALRKELRLPKVASAKPCNRELSRAGIRVQNRIDRRAPGADRVLYRIFHNRPTNIWGNVWFTPCDGGLMQVGVAWGGSARDTRVAVREARSYLRKKKLTRSVRLVAVRSTYRELSDQVVALSTVEDGGAFAAPDEITWGIEPQRNAVVIEAEYRVPESDRALLRELARTSPVNVIVRIDPAPDPNAPIRTYAVPFTLDRATVDRSAATVTVKVEDPSCGATGAEDVAQRFAGVRIRRLEYAYVLTARLRVNPEWGRLVCADGPPDGSSITTAVTLPEKLGRRGLVDGAEGPSGFHIVALPPRGASAIRSLSPKFMYMNDDCDAQDVRRAFKGRKKTEWCFF
ncbi:MAG: hypothetical protein WC558_06675 [Patulibacter sp.]